MHFETGSLTADLYDKFLKQLAVKSAKSEAKTDKPSTAKPVRASDPPLVPHPSALPVSQVEHDHSWSGLKPQGNALDIDNINDLFMIAYPEADLHTWQIEEQMRWSGYLDPSSKYRHDPTDKLPIVEILVANNSAGKDSVLIAPAVCFMLCRYEKSSVVFTSSSHRQLKDQTEKNIRNFADKLNDAFGQIIFEYKDLHLWCVPTASECTMFATDKPGKVEGYHPIEPGRKMMVLMNEVKSVDEDIIKALLRCFGWTHWIEVSSAGLVDTHFHRQVKRAKRVYPEVPKPGESFTRTITIDDCPHISDANKDALIEDCGGVDSPIAQASLYSQFIHLDSVYVIPSHLFDYETPKDNMLGGHYRLGLDCALGGAEAVLCICKGNRQVAQEVWRISDEPTLTRRILEALERHGVRGQELNVDVGGLGLPIAHRLKEAGINVNHVRNEAKAFRRVYRNRGTENWWTVRRLVQDKILILLPDPKLRDQLKKRRYKILEDNTLMVEPKREAASRGEPSPDRADALVLCFCNYSVEDVYREAVSRPNHRVGKYIVDLSKTDEAEEAIRGWIGQRTNIEQVSGNLMTKVRNLDYGYNRQYRRRARPASAGWWRRR